MQNTSEYIPEKSISPVLIKNKEFPDYPFLSGTGFFVEFPPYDLVFFVTAKHCAFYEDNTPKGVLQIPMGHNSSDRKAVPFSSHLLASLTSNHDDLEDVAIYVVGDVTPEEHKILKERCLRLQHQDDLDAILQYVISNQENVRIAGFHSDSKSIDYEASTAVSQLRGTYGKLTGEVFHGNIYAVGSLSWKEESLDGFSGSPVLALIPIGGGLVQPVPLGVVSTGSGQLFRFTSINIVTNMIAEYIESSIEGE